MPQLDEHIRHPGKISIRVVYRDTDLIELETEARTENWCGVATSYTSADALRESAAELKQWTYKPDKPFIFESGADTGIGWLKLRFYTVDMAGHIVCDVTMATRSISRVSEDAWRFAVSFPTEPALIERFCRELISLADTLDGEAILDGVQP
jgi:hypothetical protein